MNISLVKRISKKDFEAQINNFFSDLSGKSPSEIKKIVRLAMKEKIKLGSKRKLFCKRCFSPYKISRVRMRKGIKSVECENCGYKSRWRIKTKI